MVIALGLSSTSAAESPLSEVRFEKTTPGGGSVAISRATHNGIPVVGGASVTRFDRNGRAVSLRRHAVSIPASLSTIPSVKPAQVWNAVGGQGNLDLVVDADPDMGARLSYRVFRWEEGDPLSLERVFVDAQSGAIYRREPLVLHALQKAKVYPLNPKKTPALTEVVLPHLDGAKNLSSEDVIAISCKDPGVCRKDESTNTFFYDCDFDTATKPDAQGNFYYGFQGHTNNADGLAEVSAYYHMSRAFDGVRAITGIQNLVEGGVVAIANFRMSAEPEACQGEKFVGKEAFVPWDNAAFVPGGFGLLPFPHSAILVGQGSTVDFAYDGDVLIHEFGHGYHHKVAPELSVGFIDKLGLNSTPGGLMEGYADLVALALTDDPEIGEYAGGDQPIRLLDNTARCPDHITGEMHMDSEIFTGAVYEARKLLATTKALKTKFDAAVLASAAGLGAYDGFATAGKNLVEEMNLALGAQNGKKVEEILKKRGVMSCERVVPADPKNFLWMTGYEKGKNTPGPLQFRYELTEPATKLGVIASYIAPTLAKGDLVAVIKKGKDPIQWTKSANDFTGDYQYEKAFQALPDDQDAGMAVVEGTFAPGTYHIMLVHRGEGADVIGGIQFGHAGAGAADGNLVTLSHKLDSFGEPQAEGGCQISNASSGAALLLAFALIAIRRRRRLE